MGEYTAILKGYRLHILYGDGSFHLLRFDMDEAQSLASKVAELFLNDLDMIQSFTVTKVWSQPGETVNIPVKYQS